jgi:hypothetical protein
VKAPSTFCCLPLLLALTFTVGVAPAGAETTDEPPGSPQDTGGDYVPVPSDYYDPIAIEACGTTVTLTSGDVREVEWKVRVRDDGRTVIKYRGGSTVDLTRASDDAFLDELDVSGPYTERISADQTKVSVSLRGPSLVWPLSAIEADVFAEEGFPGLLYFEAGRVAIDLEFPEDPAVLEPTSVDVTRNTARGITDVCELLDEAPTRGGS